MTQQFILDAGAAEKHSQRIEQYKGTHPSLGGLMDSDYNGVIKTI